MPTIFIGAMAPEEEYDRLCQKLRIRVLYKAQPSKAPQFVCLL